MVDKTSEEWRAQCEARHWLKGIGRSKDKFDALVLRIKQVRGAAAADKLAAGIRAEFKVRRKNPGQSKPIHRGSQ
jgi:hypothetical protein